MDIWEWREWFSIQYPEYTQDWITSKDQVNDSFFKVSNSEFLLNTSHYTRKILEHCELPITGSIIEFAAHWNKTQQYLIDKLQLVNKIVECVLEDFYLEWKPISIIEEGMVQNKLRTNKIEIACDGLNEFPCNSEDLKKVILPYE